MAVLRTERTYPLTLTADPLNTSIVAAYDWAAEDGSTTLANGKDHSGNGHDYVPFGTTPTIVETPAGKGRDTSIGRTVSNAYYDAAGAVTVGLDVGTGDFSIYKRIRSPSVAPATTLLRNIERIADSGGSKILISLYEVTSTGKWHWHVVFDASTIVLNWNDTPGLSINTDSILHITRVGGVVKCFVDGVLEKTTVSNTTNILSTTAASHAIVGNFGSGNVINAIHVDNIYWSRGLSEAEVTAHAANPYSYYEYSTVPDTVTVTSPTDGETLSADIDIAGTYEGGTTVTAIEASFNGGAYATVDAAPASGSFSGTLSGQSAGTGTLTVRSLNGASVVATDTVENITVSTDAIAFTVPDTSVNGAVAYRMFQRDASNQALVRITGTYSGSPTSIEYQWAGGAWTTLIASPSGEQFDETVTLQGPEQGNLSIRFSNSTGISATLASVGVGDVYLVGGQSNHVGMSAAYVLPEAPGANLDWLSVKLGKNGIWQPHLEESGTPFDDRTDATYSVQTNASTPLGSYFGALATLIMEQGIPVGFVPCALGSSGIAAWAVNTATSSLYGAMLARSTQIGDYKKVLWWQGENETTGSMTQSEFAAELNELVDDWYSRTGKQWIVLAINEAGTGANFQAIHDAIVEVGQTNPNVASYADLDGSFTSSIHYGTTGEISEIANRVFLATNFVTGLMSWSEDSDSVSSLGEMRIDISSAWSEENDVLDLNGFVGEVVSGAIALDESDDLISISAICTLNISGVWLEDDDILAITSAIYEDLLGVVSWQEDEDILSLASTLTVGVDMSLIVEDGTGKSDADSYISVDYADTYHAKYGNTSWASLTTENKAVYLRRATDYMVGKYRLRWKGQRTLLTQALDWPRFGVIVEDAKYYTYGSFQIDQNTVPNEIKNACAELALRASIGALFKDQGQKVLSKSVGPISVTYDKDSPAQKRYTQVDAMLGPFLSGSGMTMKLART